AAGSTAARSVARAAVDESCNSHEVSSRSPGLVTIRMWSWSPPNAVRALPGWAATAIVEAPATGGRRWSAYVKSRLASLDWKYARWERYVLAKWGSSKFITPLL